MKECKYQKQIFAELEKISDRRENLRKEILEHLNSCPSCQDFFNSYQYITKTLKSGKNISPPELTLTEKLKNLTIWFPYKAIVSMAVTLILLVTISLFFHSQFRKSELVKITFQVNLPAAFSVAVVGDFNDWNIQKGQLFPGKKYWVRTFFVRPGRYQYIVVVDGKKILLPGSALNSVADGFGSQNAVLNVRQNSVLKI